MQGDLFLKNEKTSNHNKGSCQSNLWVLTAVPSVQSVPAVPSVPSVPGVPAVPSVPSVPAVPIRKKKSVLLELSTIA